MYWLEKTDKEKGETQEILIPLELPLPMPGEIPYPQEEPQKKSHLIEIDMA
ncbi:hypothetical protein K1X76_07760 [bacterium]|nr:hypothetical protein [bacterium]